ncbi:hypothetical protein L9F63_001071, partial [Diploptera punctata]
MEDDLPTAYDVIVVGTGMTESIIAAAASRIGKKVLHLDSNEYYGGLWASFNFEGLQKWMEDCRQPPTVSEDNVALSESKEGETMMKAGNQFSVVFNIEEKWYILEELEESLENQSFSKNTQTDTEEQGKAGGDVDNAKKSEDESEKKEGEGSESDAGDSKDIAFQGPIKQWSQSKLKKEYRKFNLDLAPKLLFARGSLVELLISSNIARYAEFRSVTRVLTWLNGRLEPVPCSRADVFATHHVTVVEKRMLMKLLTVCMEYENSAKEFEGFEDKPFIDYLKSKKLTPNLLHYVLYAIAMASNTTPCMEGVARTQRFLNSLGRYGNTPFLWPMYGSGEIPQCFCRLCAVFGGLYHLKRAAEAVIVSSGEDAKTTCKGIVSGGQRLDTSHLVMGVGYAPPQFLQGAPSGGLSRGIFVTDRTLTFLLDADKESLTLLQFPPIDGTSQPVTVIEVGPSTNACPLGLYVVHMTCKQQKTAREDLQAVVDHLLHIEFSDGTVSRIETDTQSTQTVSAKKHSEEGEGVEATEDEKSEQVTTLKPQVFWSLFFNCPETSDCDLSASVPANVYLCSGPDLDLDFEYAVKQ